MGIGISETAITMVCSGIGWRVDLVYRARASIKVEAEVEARVSLLYSTLVALYYTNTVFSSVPERESF